MQSQTGLRPWPCDPGPGRSSSLSGSCSPSLWKMLLDAFQICILGFSISLPIISTLLGNEQ